MELFDLKEEEKGMKDEEDKDRAIYDKKYLYLLFNRDNPIRLPAKRIFEGQVTKKDDNKSDSRHLIWTIRKEFTISLEPS